MTPYSNERTFRMFVAYATSHRAMLKRKKVKELGWVEK